MACIERIKSQNVVWSLLVLLALSFSAHAALHKDAAVSTAENLPRPLPTLRAPLTHAGPRHRASSPLAVNNCTEFWFNQTLNHFAWRAAPAGQTTFLQRYYICSEYYKPRKGAVFFYPGNEADVTLYIENTGLMWENAQEFGALLIFAEHRYYGLSVVPPNATTHWYLSTEQALADYAVLLQAVLPQYFADELPVIAFGGSYGGMLAAWMRMKYPHIIAGSIAASAPVRSFEGDKPPPDFGGFWKIVTADASTPGGSDPTCATNWHKAFGLVTKYSSDQSGREWLGNVLRLCTPLKSPNDGVVLNQWVQSALAYLAMGDYPYSSPYILNGQGVLPPWPMRAACEPLTGNFTTDEELLERFADAFGVYYNYSGSLECFNINADVNNASAIVVALWNFQSCTEMIQPMSTDGIHDMFWSAPWTNLGWTEWCSATFGVIPQYTWISTQYGNWGPKRPQASNIVFSNGMLDPWHYGGVLQNNSATPSIIAVVMEDSAHHLDLMFSNPLDPPSVVDGRRIEMANVRLWIEEFNKNQGGPKE